MNPVGFVIVAAAVIAVVLAHILAAEATVMSLIAAVAVSSILWLLYVALSPKRGDR